jgi:hypothetical protein
VPKPSTIRNADKPAAHQVEVRLEVAPEVDKSRVVQWVELLRAAGVASVSEVPGAATRPKAKDEPAVRSAGRGRVLVRAALGPAGNLHIGADAFRPSDRGRLDAFVKKLRQEGAPGADPTAPLWGLTQPQFDLLLDSLKPPSRFALRDQRLGEFLDELRARTKLPMQLSPDATKRAADMRLTMSTGRLSIGAALAYVLGQHGLAFEPRADDAGKLSLSVLSQGESKRPWPLGMEPQKLPGTVAPKLMAAARYKIKDIPLDELISQFAQQLEMDVLLDRAALAEKHMDPDKLRATTEIPGGTATAAIRKTLAPLNLKHELRIDEADQPFLWITVGEPTGPAPQRKP